MAAAPGDDDGAALAVLRTNGVMYELEDPVTTIGRSPDCDIVLRGSRSISSRHARIVVKNPARRDAVIEDLGSLNGCFVNDTRVKGQKLPLKTGDLIKFGYDAATYMFEFPADKVRRDTVECTCMAPHCVALCGVVWCCTLLLLPSHAHVRRFPPSCGPCV